MWVLVCGRTEGGKRSKNILELAATMKKNWPQSVTLLQKNSVHEGRATDQAEGT